MGCCSATDFSPATDATLGESQRVNYSFGMVLGVDDFRQEHAWLAGRDQRALRETIGYGVLAGLGVSCNQGASASPPAGECTVRVQPGLALAPDGRLVAIATEQCARLDKWLTGAGVNHAPAAGHVTACVLLAFDETLGTPVPIPGEPCRDESAQQADARWSDGFRLGFAWAADAPLRAEDQALRLFCAWLKALPVRDEPPAGAVSLAQFRTAVRDVIGLALRERRPPPATLPDDGHGRPLVLPRAAYTQFLGAAFDVWTRELRAQHLAPYGPVQLTTLAGSPDGERAIVLAELRFTLGSGGVLQSDVTVESLGQPQLLHLRLIQEWLLAQPENDAPWDAYYVLGRADDRLPHAQNLLADFFPPPAAVSKTGHGPMARVDRSGSGPNATALLAPAQKYAGKDGADYYGPGMEAPIRVADGGTGQSGRPADFQLLVGHEGRFALGDLAAGGEPPNLTVTHGREGHPHDIVVDTVQPIHSLAKPGFAGLTLSGTSSSPPKPALQVSGGAVVDGLAIGELGPALLAADAQHRVIEARRWDGTPFEERDPPLQYYGPGQSAPVRIEDGGTGLDARPKTLQLLVGGLDEQADSYVVATLAAGPNASVALEYKDLGPDNRAPRRAYTLTVDAKSGGGMKVVGRDGGNVMVDVQDTTATLDTVALPTFSNVRLTKPEGDDATHRVGWNNKTQRLVASDEAARSRVRLVNKPNEARVLPTDEVLVFVGDTTFKLELPEPSLTDGRTLVLKVLPPSGGVAVGKTDFDDLELKPNEAMTVVASRDLKRWLLVSVLRRG